MVGAHAVKDNDSLMLITANGMMIKMEVADVRVIGRATQGVRLINLQEGDKLVSATAVEPDDEVLAETDDDAPAETVVGLKDPFNKEEVVSGAEAPDKDV